MAVQFWEQHQRTSKWSLAIPHAGGATAEDFFKQLQELSAQRNGLWEKLSGGRKTPSLFREFLS